MGLVRESTAQACIMLYSIVKLVDFYMRYSVIHTGAYGTADVMCTMEMGYVCQCCGLWECRKSAQTCSLTWWTCHLRGLLQYWVASGCWSVPTSRFHQVTSPSVFREDNIELYMIMHELPGGKIAMAGSWASLSHKWLLLNCLRCISMSILHNNIITMKFLSIRGRHALCTW